MGCVWVVDGAGSFTHSQTFDFSALNALPSYFIESTDTIGAGSAPYSQKYTTTNVAVTGGSLQLRVPGGQTADPVFGAEIETSETDILYGSVRTWVQVSSVAGTVHGKALPFSFSNPYPYSAQNANLHFHPGLFFYKADNQESDIEILTGNLKSGVHYTNQNVVLGGESTTATDTIPTDATTAMNEYRLDWLSDRTEFYLNGVLQTTLTANVPSQPGEWIWNNWR